MIPQVQPIYRVSLFTEHTHQLIMKEEVKTTRYESPHRH
jgi:hypothetical protein